MKRIFLAAILLATALFAQVPQVPGLRPPLPRGPLAQAPANMLPDNYQVALTITDKDAQPVEVSVVVASTQFTAALGELGLTFSGSVEIEDSGAIMVNYALGWETPINTGNNIQYKTSSTQGSVRLKLGEEVNIIRAGTRTARISIKKLEAPPAK